MTDERIKDLVQRREIDTSHENAVRTTMAELTHRHQVRGPFEICPSYYTDSAGGSIPGQPVGWMIYRPGVRLRKFWRFTLKRHLRTPIIRTEGLQFLGNTIIVHVFDSEALRAAELGFLWLRGQGGCVYFEKHYERSGPPVSEPVSVA